MEKYSNAQILAAVVTEWSRPAVSQLTASSICKLPAMAELQQSIINTGLVGANYRLQSEIEPFLVQAAPCLMEPMLEQAFSRIPDKSIPQIARTTIKTAMMQPQFSILDGLVVFDQEDLKELLDLVELNLPVAETKSYKIKTR